MKIISAVLLTVTMFVCCTCELAETRYPIIVLNNASHDIQFYVATLGQEKIYPDTMLPSQKPSLILVKAGGSGKFSISRNWEGVFSELPSDTLSIFVLHTDTVKNNPWHLIKDEYRILKRYDLSLGDLKNGNWRLIYD